jgi:hypothetical protein
VTDRDQTPAQRGRRLAATEAVGAVYRMGFKRGATDSVLDDVAVDWFDLILPIAALFALSVVVAGVEVFSAKGSATELPLALVLAASVGAQLLRFSVAAVVTWALARHLAVRERVLPGFLAYLWMEAALLQPWLWIVRSSIGGEDPWWVVIFFGYVPTAAMIFVAGRVMEMAFKLSSIWLGIFLALAGTATVSVLARVFDLPA